MQQNARIHSLDIIRGIAILCILFANLPTMTGLDPFNQAGYIGTDKVIRFLVDLFIQAKFYTIFAFLFGVGFYIFMKNTEAKGYPMYRLFIRRLCILLLFGLLQFTFLWYGDILHAYALAGFILLFFYKRSTRLIFIAGCSFLMVSYVLHIIVFLRASSSISEVPNYYQYMFTGNTTNHTVNLFIHYSHQ
ncbi:heparan-alpha-glucosaminide N-acetyltransferase domain-containing protein, partial [Bacillus thuringiensis]|nr:heparan-alpha-glucosaminide N-acetyltransferase domain-containing protein [Bacillus thuringiensis]